MLGGIVVQLVLAEQHRAPRPVEAVLVEVVRHALVLAGALVVLQRVRLPTLAEDVHFKLGAAPQPTLKRLREVGLRQVQTRRRGRGRRRRRLIGVGTVVPADRQRGGGQRRGGDGENGVQRPQVGGGRRQGAW